jgi:GTP:adenosylcobinamide-phosphate guanylyltransferase
MTALTVAILAAQRAGIINPIAARFGVSHKCLAPICGRPLIAWVFDTVAATPGVARVRIAIEADGQAGVEPLTAPLRAAGIAVDFVPAANNLADSVIACAEGVAGPLILTTADNVNLSVDALQQAAAALADGAEVIFSLARREDVLAARGEIDGPAFAHVGPYKFRDGRFSNCNLYALNGKGALVAAEMFREGGQFSKQRGRLIRAVGLWNVALYLTKQMTLDGAARRLSRRFGVRIQPIVFADGAQAIDVDNDKTYAHSERILSARQASAG